MPAKTHFNNLKTYFRTPRGAIVGLWVAFFFFWASQAPFVPYVSLYYESIGLSGSQIGQLAAVRASIAFISAILLAFLSDFLRRRKVIFNVSILGMIVFLLMFPRAASFATLLPIVTLYSIFLSPVSSILDEDTLRALDNPLDYSRVRIGGTFGWGIVMLTTGWIIGLPGMPLSAIFYLNIIFLVLLLVLSIFLPNSDLAPDAQKASFADVREMMRVPFFLPWMGILFLWGFTTSALMNFLFIHIKHLGGSSFLMGASMAVSTLGELTSFTIAKRLQGRVGSRRMIALSCALRAVWFALVSVIQVPLWILPVQFLGGASFALSQAGSVSYVDERTPRRIGTTAQAIRSAVLLSLGVAVGSLVNGAVYQAYGSFILFRAMAYTALAAFLLSIFLRRLEHKRKPASP